MCSGCGYKSLCLNVWSKVDCAYPHSFSSASHSIPLGFISLVRFLRMRPFSPTIEAVTFRLRGWCMLGAFLLPAFNCLGHEFQNILSPCDGMHVCTDETSVYTLSERVLGERSQKPC